MRSSTPRRSLTLATIACCAVGWVSGCQTTKKVSNTLALNELENRAGYAELQGDDAAAMDLWGEYVRRRPHEAKGQYRLGALLLEHGDARRAVDHLWVAHDLKISNIVYLETLAEALYQAGERETMFRLLNDTLEEGGLANGHLRLAKFAARAGLADEAEESLRIAAAIDGTSNDRAYRQLAHLARQTGDPDAEIEAWRTVLWFDVRDAEANARLAEMGMIPGPSLALPPRTDG